MDVLQAEVRVDSGKRAAAKMRKVSSEPISHVQGGSGVTETLLCSSEGLQDCAAHDRRASPALLVVSSG